MSSCTQRNGSAHCSRQEEGKKFHFQSVVQSNSQLQGNIHLQTPVFVLEQKYCTELPSLVGGLLVFSTEHFCNCLFLLLPLKCRKYSKDIKIQPFPQFSFPRILVLSTHVTEGLDNGLACSHQQGFDLNVLQKTHHVSLSQYIAQGKNGSEKKLVWIQLRAV